MKKSLRKVLINLNHSRGLECALDQKMSTHIQNLILQALPPHELRPARAQMKKMTDEEIAAYYLNCPDCGTSIIPLPRAVELAQDASDWSGWMALCKREQESTPHQH